jgi:rubredoxin-NAD+ reductase
MNCPAASPGEPSAQPARQIWVCIVCGLVYDERLGLPEDGIAPGTCWEDVPDAWMCPDCGVGKADFELLQP